LLISKKSIENTETPDFIRDNDVTNLASIDNFFLSLKLSLTSGPHALINIVIIGIKINKICPFLNSFFQNYDAEHEKHQALLSNNY